MKRQFKLLACLLVVIAMVFTLASCDLVDKIFGGDEPEHVHNYVDGKCECGEADPNYVPAPTTYTVYLLNKAGWEQVAVYYWNVGGEVAWPGDLITVGEDGLYKAELGLEFGKLIFNNNNNGAQTADLTAPTDDNIVYDNVANEWITYEEAIDALAAMPIQYTVNVATFDTFCYNDMLETPVVDSFTAVDAGFYTFNVPAGLGLWGKASVEADPWGDPEVPFVDNMAGLTYTVELEAGEKFEFYVGSATVQEWTITVTYTTEMPPQPTVLTLEDGDNAFTLQEIDLNNGVTGYLSVYEDAVYTFTGTKLYISVYNSWGMLVTRGYETVTVALEANYYEDYSIVLGAEAIGDYSVNVSNVKPTTLEDGENTVTVDADGADCVYYAENTGDYFFNVTGATVTISGVTANEDGSYTLESYTNYSIVITAETAADYVVTVVAPVFLNQYAESNTVTVGADGTVVFFQTGDNGHYAITGEGLTIVVADAEGNVVDADDLLPGYTVYTVTITAAEAGDYDVKIVFTAPVGSYDNPEKVESFPATFTPTLEAEYDNYYYQFVAPYTGHATLTYTIVSGGLYTVDLDGVESETTTITVPVVKGVAYKVYFSAKEASEVNATLSIEEGELTEAEWKNMITSTTIEFANGSDVTITQDWSTQEHQVFHYQYDDEWNVIFKAYYSYTVTVNADGSLTLKLTYIEGYEGNEGTPAAIGDIKVELVDGEWVASCIHSYTNGACVCGDTIPYKVAVDTLKTGDKVLIGADAYGKLLSMVKVSTHYNKGVNYTETNFDNVTDDEIFVVTVNEDGTYSFTSVSDKVLAMAGSYNSLNDTGANDDWAITAVSGATNEYYVKNTVRGTYLEWFNSNNNWSTYSNNSDAQFEISFYLVEAAATEA